MYGEDNPKASGGLDLPNLTRGPGALRKRGQACETTRHPRGDSMEEERQGREGAAAAGV